MKPITTEKYSHLLMSHLTFKWQIVYDNKIITTTSYINVNIVNDIKFINIICKSNRIAHM